MNSDDEDLWLCDVIMGVYYRTGSKYKWLVSLSNKVYFLYLRFI